MSLIAPNNALWALDFQFDATEDNRTIKLLNVIDEFTRECLAIVVERSIDADRVVATLDRLVVERGAPAFVRFDNGHHLLGQMTGLLHLVLSPLSHLGDIGLTQGVDISSGPGQCQPCYHRPASRRPAVGGSFVSPVTRGRRYCPPA